MELASRSWIDGRYAPTPRRYEQLDATLPGGHDEEDGRTSAVDQRECVFSFRLGSDVDDVFM